MKDKLTRLERQLENLVEDSLTRLLGADISAAAVAADLARAMEDHLRTDASGNSFAPDCYAITLEAGRAARLLKQAPRIQQDLADGILRAARESGFLLEEEPTITLAGDPGLRFQELHILAWHSGKPLDSTQAMAAGLPEVEAVIPQGAFLIVDGRKHFALERAVINVGRRDDNHLVIEDARASRLHAQIRVRDGRFVIFDLASTSGTKVNGRPISQHILQAGDVVTIGAMRMVYGEDSGTGSDSTSTFISPPRTSETQAREIRLADDLDEALE